MSGSSERVNSSSNPSPKMVSMIGSSELTLGLKGQILCEGANSSSNSNAVLTS